MTMEKIATAYDWLLQRYGVSALDIEENPANTILGAADLVIAPLNPSRVGLIVCNLSINVVTLRPRYAATALIGIVLVPAGGIMTIDVERDFLLPAQEWHGIAAGAGSQIYVLGVVLA